MSKLIDRAKKEGTPLIDGETVTFVWSGKTAPQLVGDWTDWEWGGRPITLTKVAAGVWSHQITLPRDTYLEYAYIAPEGRVRDPFNPRLITNGMGKMNHYFTMPDGQHTTLVRAARGIKRGKVSQQRIAGDDMIVGQQRTVYLYQPPTDEPCPLLMVLDGKDYFTRAKLPVIVDNLIAQG
ncbi:MAG: esterase family protein, partial [Anaerolineae bacterium]|nr:esterase family protein [Anaerolineae bacterium]